MTKKQGKSGTIDVKALLAGDEGFLQALVRTALVLGASSYTYAEATATQVSLRCVFVRMDIDARHVAERVLHADGALVDHLLRGYFNDRLRGIEQTLRQLGKERRSKRRPRDRDGWEVDWRHSLFVR